METCRRQCGDLCRCDPLGYRCNSQRRVATHSSGRRTIMKVRKWRPASLPGRAAFHPLPTYMPGPTACTDGGEQLEPAFTVGCQHVTRRMWRHAGGTRNPSPCHGTPHKTTAWTLKQLGGLLRCSRIKTGRCSLQWPGQFISELRPRFASCRYLRPDPGDHPGSHRLHE